MLATIRSPLSVVIPTRGTRELTLACLRSVAAAGGLPVEVIVVDDGSRDGTAEAVARAGPEARVIRHEAPRGFAASANAGLRTARGHLLLLLNSDAALDPGALDAFRTAFEAAPGLGIAGARLRYPDGRPQWSGGAEPSALWCALNAASLMDWLAQVPGYRRLRPLDVTADRHVDWVPGAALAMRRRVWEQVGPLDEGYQVYAQDLDLCTRAREAGWLVAVLAGVGAVHHLGATIRQTACATSGRDESALWLDLVRWVERRHGASRAQVTARALAAGGRLRLLGDRLGVSASRSADGPRWQQDATSVRAALDALRRRRPKGHTER